MELLFAEKMMLGMGAGQWGLQEGGDPDGMMG